ncbi:MAG TPA: OmpA family protein, partial [Cyclobacteriaceae bacterium]|nr:OmpA family protein [Cyclobacteriaceae bacterium]
VSSISTDNNTIIYAEASKFMVRRRNESGWGEPQDLGVSFTNEAHHFEGMLSSDGKAILFTVRNSANLFYGKADEERDIYVSTQQADGSWTPPLNLGKTINTYGDEVSPFLAADGRTLYYSTNGKPGYGGTDVFMSRRIGNSWTQWTEPVNLGPEINSTGFDAYYVIPASGAFAYMVSDIGGFGKADIVQIKLPQEIKPDPVVLIHGRTLDAKTRMPLSADIHIENLALNKEVGEAISDPQTGNYKIVLPYGYLYGFHGTTPGYLSVNENMDLMTISTYSEMEKDLLLVPIRVGESIQLNNVFFEQAKPILKPSSYPELDRLVEIMKANPTMEIVLNGYTDNIGRPVSLIALSMDRVGTVRSYMISKGIAGSRITGKGYGPENPVVKNDTEEHRRMNRRVEFKITKK